MIETGRLLLREYTQDDFDALYEIMSDPETMQHYPAPFDEDRTKRWIEWNLENYRQYGFGLWAVVLKETGEFIGDCGVTIQNIDGEMLPEIGYHIHKKYWRRGFAKEAARAVRDWVFLNTDYDTIYSYMKYTNVGSYSTAMANGMKKVKEYPDPKNTVSYAYAITREEWENLKDRTVFFGVPEDIGSWMNLVRRVSRNFPGLETEQNLEEHRQTVLKFMGKRQALCTKNGEEITGVLLFSRNRNMICCLAVSPEHRRNGIASKLLEKALDELDRSRDITVSTFREEDEKGVAPRALYRKYGFREGELTEEFGYPNQVFILKGDTVR